MCNQPIIIQKLSLDHAQFTSLGDMSMEKLAAVESILGSSISAIDTKTEQEKLTLDAKNKAKKLFGDAKERKDAKKKEKKGMVETPKMTFSS